MDFNDQIAPFSWIEHDDGSASVTMYTSHKYKKKLFKSRKKEGAIGSGYDWESLAQAFIQELTPDLHQAICFDSEHLMFCAYSSDINALRRFVLMFKETCENDNLIANIFSHAVLPKPVTKEDIRKVFDEIIGKSEK